MPKKIILHVGLHKTASTYLQNIVFPAVQNYQLISRPYTQHNKWFNLLQYADDSLYDIETHRNVLKAIIKGNTIISDEALSGKPTRFSHINRTTIAKRLSNLFPQASVILFLRNQPDILKSIYNQYVKMGGELKIDEYFWSASQDYSYRDYLRELNLGRFSYNMNTLYYNTNYNNINLDTFKYTELISTYIKAFSNTHIFLYEDLLLNPLGIMERIEEITGEKVNLNGYNKRIVNQSIKVSKLVRYNNRLSVIYGKRYVSRINKILSKISFEEKIEEYINKKTEIYADNNAYVFEKYSNKINTKTFNEYYPL